MINILSKPHDDTACGDSELIGQRQPPSDVCYISSFPITDNKLSSLQHLASRPSTKYASQGFPRDLLPLSLPLGIPDLHQPRSHTVHPRPTALLPQERYLLLSIQARHRAVPALHLVRPDPLSRSILPSPFPPPTHFFLNPTDQPPLSISI